MTTTLRPARTRIKICGLRETSDVIAACEAGADAIGFVLYDKSVRAVTVQRAAELSALLPPFVTPVCLFVNASPELIEKAMAAIPGLLPQFHGDETPEQCRAAGRPYLRAVAVKPDTRLVDYATRFHDAAGLLLDAPVEGYGGGGQVFDWSLLPSDVARPVVLSGGLNPANVIDGVMRVRPWAVDVSSGVESSRGVKDAALIRRFCEAVREADARMADAIT